ncbi:MAG: hypothetical protein NT169_17840 [Chloroflexi bacterium]|nr:hypothetical protein [Chloroflexota bacterium]
MRTESIQSSRSILKSFQLPLATLCLITLALLAVAHANAAVGLLSFTATPQADGAILVRWETATELSTLAFELFRTEAEIPMPWDETPIRVEPARGDGITGAVYTYRDTAVIRDGAYYYWLQERTQGGGIGGQFGPIRAVGGQPPTTVRRYLPLAPVKGR